MTSSLPGFEAADAGRTVTVAGVLRVLTRERILSVARSLGLDHLDPRATKARLANDVAKARPRSLAEVLGHLLRDELRKALEAHELDTEGRSRRELWRRLLARSRAPLDAPTEDAAALSPTQPREGRLAVVRQRQYLITGVHPPPETADATPTRPAERVELVCLDDDAQGRELEVFWPLELGARVVEPGAEGLGDVTRLDAPDLFGAYLYTMQWSSVSATDNQLFQSPFRAGIQPLVHQIPALSKALDLPRANLFIADDVGLGKTIEAGLVLQELILRGQVERVLIVTPAAITLQWRDEMERRFGLRFEIMNRGFVARRRRERGFRVNPWATHSRFIVSYHTLKRPEYLEPLRTFLDKHRRRTLLILDEAHTVAPASGARYAVDSGITRTVRDLAARFDNRLFLSATPHNGHSNSFSALLEILDPARFTRGVPVDDPEALAPVMIRRLKSDLKALGTPYPDRRILRGELVHGDDGWRITWQEPGGATAPAIPLGPGHDVELRLSELLAAYTDVARPLRKRGRLVFVSLQKRLLSSLEALHRTLQKHAQWLTEQPEPAPTPTQPDLLPTADPEVYGQDDDAADAAEAAEVAARSRDFEPPSAAARRLLAEMQALTSRHRHERSPKVLALLHWIGAHCCPAVAPSARAAGDARRWTDRRVILFTEYGDTKRYLRDQLREAVAGTDRAAERIVELQGGLNDERRAEIQGLFNDPGSPARILLATDAAREGVNLQGACADLFHYDVPWNPARLEQRNGRIDRTGQVQPEVRCHYFSFPQRPEDRVLDVLVRKVDVIRAELGSLGTVVLDQVESRLRHGIDHHASDALASEIEAAAPDAARRDTATRELESARSLERLKREIDTAARHLQRSARTAEVDPDALRAAVDVGCRLAGAGPLRPTTVALPGDRTCDAFLVPHNQLAGWDRTLDTLRPPRRRDVTVWDWRDEHPPLPVVFRPPERMNDPVVHLHLEHPFVKRALSRFRSQGYGKKDLSRATIVRVGTLQAPRVVGFARLSVFGHGARRLHDELVAVSAPFTEAEAPPELLGPRGHERTLTALQAALVAAARDPGRFPQAQARRLAPRAAADFAALWPHLEAEADASAASAEVALEARGRKDAEALARILRTQQSAIDRRIRQLELDLRQPDSAWAKDELGQVRRDGDHMRERRRQLDAELETEPAAIRELFEVRLRRVVPVGLVYLWPEARG